MPGIKDTIRSVLQPLRDSSLIELSGPSDLELIPPRGEMNDRLRSKAAMLRKVLANADELGYSSADRRAVQKQIDALERRSGDRVSGADKVKAFASDMWGKAKNVDPMIAAEVAAPIAGGGIGAAVAPKGKRLQYALGGVGIGGIAGLVGEAYRRGMFDRK